MSLLTTFLIAFTVSFTFSFVLGTAIGWLILKDLQRKDDDDDF